MDEKENKVKEVIQDGLEKLRTQSMLLGAQSMCSVVLDMITEWESKPGKRTYADYKRLVNKISGFCKTGLSKEIETPKFDYSIEENTIQD